MDNSAPNKRQEDARHFYISFSLHCLRPTTRRFAIFIVGKGNDFLPPHVIRHLLNKNLLLKVTVLLLVSVSVLHAQAVHPRSIPRCADISMAGIFLENRTSAEGVLGHKIALVDSLDLPEARYWNQAKSEILTVIFHPGDIINTFSEFKVTLAGDASDTAGAHRTRVPSFVSGKGVRIGLSISAIQAILGDSAVESTDGDLTVLRYRLDDFEKSRFLKWYNMPIYYGEYKFRKDSLIEFAFGFEYP